MVCQRTSFPIFCLFTKTELIVLILNRAKANDVTEDVLRSVR